MKRSALAIVLTALSCSAHATDISSGVGQIEAIQQMQNHPMTFFKCSEIAPNGFVNPNDGYYVQGKLDNGNNVIFLGLVYGTDLGMGDVFVYDTLNDLKGGVYDPMQLATVQIDRGDKSQVNITLKTAKETDQAQCKLDTELTQKAADEYRYQNPTPKGGDITEKDLTPKQKEQYKKYEAANIDDVLGDLSVGNPKAKQHPTSKVASSSGTDISPYVSKVANYVAGLITDKDQYKGKRCEIGIHIQRNGYINSIDNDGGDADLCSHVMNIMNTVHKLPTPPSDDVYNVVKDAPYNFKFD
ncbi:cell envelope integrity TolA C-terminal domain-containing protein [Enterobacter hormaechei]|uniref:cell envelope integrity TolA C-terminal domain-containing protein n=1 Tax=Enterobacter hormaechei TaxID=158836 RepID=UPI0013DDD0D3|nr:cell envelope integrity TolA C-terminal domain-containing protein [Enterobacter hormaechei]EKK5437090.1 hypothetical protein [Enterobacter hormaechei]ELD3444544.1 hypothetical protein [Enterobacter hormaechei]MCF3452883.1 hypothetical protein [Enterobacter hormaechei]MCK1021758.1 hypothetical protein [Enterobacter hormaechei subsp. xiangfangensis]MCM7864427.1 hypothetical protein [Enterobacter hormaechei]